LDTQPRVFVVIRLSGDWYLLVTNDDPIEEFSPRKTLSAFQIYARHKICLR